MQFSDVNFAKKLDIARTLAEGIASHQDRLADRKLDMEFVKEIYELREILPKLESARDDLREEMIAKTKEFNEHIDKLVSKYREGKAIIKIEFDRDDWNKFGFRDKR